jgi:hypothetical protein
MVISGVRKRNTALRINTELRVILMLSFSHHKGGMNSVSAELVFIVLITVE